MYGNSGKNVGALTLQAAAILAFRKKAPGRGAFQIDLNYFLSLSSKGSPHSGQKRGTLLGSAGFQPHLSHW